MINNIQIVGVHFDLTSDEEMYIDKKIGGLDRFVPKRNREATKVDVKIRKSKRKSADDKYSCEVIFHMPSESITVNEKAASVLASIDIAENKLKVLLKKYKEKHGGPRLHRRVIKRFLGKS